MNTKQFIIAMIALVSMFSLTGSAATAQGPRPGGSAAPATPTGTGFTYQGQLKQNGALVTNTCDFQFGLWNDSTLGTQLGFTQTMYSLGVTNGLFTTAIDFGAYFTGDETWLAVAVRCPTFSGGYTTLAPRQNLTAVPYALSLRPRATVSATVEANPIINVFNSGSVYAYATGLQAVVPSSQGVGVYGQQGGGDGYAPGYAGVVGTSNTADGVLGRSVSGDGVEARSQTGTAVYAWATGNSGVNYAVYGTTSSASGYAGYFNGKVQVSGNLNVSGALTKGSGSFKIDHPLDPANKYLQHSFVESPDMKNIYDGVVTTDANGEAAVELPDYFEALNRDFRYQLTVIGQFAQAIVASEIQNNHFTIRTDKPYVRVSWQVTGIRQDPYANAHRILVEVDKTPDELGKYLYPDVYGLPSAMGVDYFHGNTLAAAESGSRH